jgi:hypothetical protein
MVLIVMNFVQFGGKQYTNPVKLLISSATCSMLVAVAANIPRDTTN